ncbi:MAG: hypothetical protein JW782_07655 [Candidatus Saganbacteria bacterium]|nr:hypothetical protein [Candidatus Saganbacteria bacterium]
MGYLLTAAVITLLFGLIFIFTPNFLASLGNLLNRVVLYLDDKLSRVKIGFGIVLILVSAWLMWTVAKYPELAYLNAVWIICLAFGLLFLFFNNWLTWLSDVSNKVIFSTDEVVVGSRKIFGVILLIASVYIFYAVYILE